MSKIKFITLLILLTFFQQSCHAETKFQSEYIISYIVDNQGLTTANYDIKLTNLLEDAFPATIELQLYQTDVVNLSATQKDKSLNIITSATDGLTSVHINVENYSIGKGKTTELRVSYSTKQIAVKNGKVWSLNIPVLHGDSNNIISQTIGLTVDNNLGKKIFISPTPDQIFAQDTTSTTYTFGNEKLLDTNIAAAFGDNQLLNFKLDYELYNPNLFSSYYEIALPPDVLDRQQVHYDMLDPKPQKSYLDGDSNVIAAYKIKPHENMLVTIKGSVKLSNTQIDASKGGDFKNLPTGLIKNYTQTQKYWDIEGKQIADLADELKDESRTVSENAENIYNYLVRNYTYDYSIAASKEVIRKGASKAILVKEGWGCMEFTDTFIAIARAMGIPARELNGYAITTDQNTKPLSLNLKSGDLLHAWPEFYDPVYGWVPIDPTWGQTSKTDYFTKLDTNHFTFVRKGFDSTSPLPAGTYRKNDDKKLVSVGFSEIEAENPFTESYKLTRTFTINIFQIIKGNRLYKLSNTGKTILYTSDNSAVLPGQTQRYFFAKDLSDLSIKNALNVEILP